MAFEMPAFVPTGRQIWRVDNTGAALREIAIVPVPAGATAERAAAAVVATFEGKPAPAAFGPAWTGWRANLVAGVGATSPGLSISAQVDLAPGTHAAVCFVPDPATGTPHLMMGMTEIFTAA